MKTETAHDLQGPNNAADPVSCCHGCGAPMHWDAKLRDTCCSIFTRSLKLTPAHIVGLINTLFGTSHPLSSTVLFPDPAPLENCTFPNQVADVPIRIVEEKGGKETAFEYCIEFVPEYNPVLGLPVVNAAMDQSASRPDASAVFTPPAKTAVLFLRDVPDIGDKLTFHLVDPNGSDTFLYTVSITTLFRRAFQANVSCLFALLPFEILRDYDPIRSAPAKEISQVFAKSYADILMEVLPQFEQDTISELDLAQILCNTQVLAREAYGDLIPMLG